MTNDQVRYEDVAGLKSRVSWGAVVAGSVVAFAVYLVLTLFFTGVGLSLTENGVRQGVGTGAMIAGLISVVAGLFAGGCTTTLLTAGETRKEAVIHGVLVWAAVTAMSLWMVSAGLKAGYSAMLGAAYASSEMSASANRTWEESARAAGVPQERIDAFKANLTPEQMRANANDPAMQAEALDRAAKAAWVSLAATLLAMASAIGGAVYGSGPRFRVVPVSVPDSRPIVAH